MDVADVGDGVALTVVDRRGAHAGDHDPVAHHREQLFGAVGVAHQQVHRGAGGAANSLHCELQRPLGDRLAVHLQDHVAAADAGLLSRGAAEHRDDRDFAVEIVDRAADPLKRAADVFGGEAVVLGADVGGVGVAEAVDDAVDRGGAQIGRLEGGGVHEFLVEHLVDLVEDQEARGAGGGRRFLIAAIGDDRRGGDSAAARAAQERIAGVAVVDDPDHAHAERERGQHHHEDQQRDHPAARGAPARPALGLELFALQVIRHSPKPTNSPRLHIPCIIAGSLQRPKMPQDGRGGGSRWQP